MKHSKFTKYFVIPLLSVGLVEVPFMAQAQAGMISTESVVAEMNHAVTQEKILNYLTRTDVQAEFLKHGVSSEEASLRVLAMSGVELAQVSNQIDQAAAGGEVLVIGLGTILVVVLILVLMGRI